MRPRDAQQVCLTLPSLPATQSCGRKECERVLTVGARSRNSTDQALGIIKHRVDYNTGFCSQWFNICPCSEQSGNMWPASGGRDTRSLGGWVRGATAPGGLQQQTWARPFPPPRFVTRHPPHPPTIPGRWTSGSSQLSSSRPYQHRPRREQCQKPIQGTGLKSLKDGSTDVRAPHLRYHSRRLALGRGPVASARTLPLRVSEAERVWQQWPRGCNPKGWHTALPGPTPPWASHCMSLSLSFPFCTTRQLDGPFPNGKSSSSYGLVNCFSAYNELEKGGAWWKIGQPQGGDQKLSSRGGHSREPTLRVWSLANGLSACLTFSLRGNRGNEGKKITGQKCSVQRAPGPE